MMRYKLKVLKRAKVLAEADTMILKNQRSNMISFFNKRI